MRSSREPGARARRAAPAAALALAFAIAGCGADGEAGGGDDVPKPDDETCRTSYLDYQTFGEPFLLDWCNGCHSAALPMSMRQRAPVDVSFDTIEGVRKHAARIVARAASPTGTMPPVGGPSAEERALLGEWIGCGAPEQQRAQ
jgi:hypothetical protein